jgi:hypothetical protein
MYVCMLCLCICVRMYHMYVVCLYVEVLTVLSLPRHVYVLYVLRMYVGVYVHSSKTNTYIHTYISLSQCESL